MTHIDAASPWVIDTRAIGLSKHSGPGHAHPIDLAVALDEPIESVVLSVPAGSIVTVQGRLESVSEGVVVSATASAAADGACSRCLTAITAEVSATIRELFAYPDSVTAETTDADEVPRIVDDSIDLRALVHDELILAMPTIPLCRDDCLGLCPECGARMDSVEPGHRHEILDPRWARLVGLVQPDHGEPANDDEEK